MKLAVVGSRTFTNYQKLIDYLSHYNSITEVVSGGARGVDSLVRRFAEEYDIPIKEFLPEYSKYGRIAPFVRNQQIVDYSDELLAIRVKFSKGTTDTINRAHKANKPTKIIDI